MSKNRQNCFLIQLYIFNFFEFLVFCSNRMSVFLPLEGTKHGTSHVFDISHRYLEAKYRAFKKHTLQLYATFKVFFNVRSNLWMRKKTDFEICFELNLATKLSIYYSFCMLGALEGIFLREGGREKETELYQEESGPWSSLAVLKFQHG